MTLTTQAAGEVVRDVFLGIREIDDVDWPGLLSEVMLMAYGELLPFMTLYRSGLGDRRTVERFEVTPTAAAMQITGTRSSVAVTVTMTAGDAPKIGWLYLNRVGPDPMTWAKLLTDTPAALSETNTLDPPLAAEITGALGEVRTAGEYAGIVLAAYRAGQTVFAAGQGRAWLEAATAPDSATPFRAGSVTKTVTALTVLRLSRAGLLDLDAPAADYLTSVRLIPNGDPVTVRALLAHTGGLPRDVPADSTVLRQLRELLADGVVFERPAGVFEYSNLGFGLLGLLIEDVTGLSYPDAVTREVFAPAGMVDSFVSGDLPATPPAAQGYDVNGGLVLPTIEYFMADVASGGLVTTSADLLRLGAAVLAEPQMWAAMPAGAGSVYANGLVLNGAPEHPFAFHNGMVPGARASLMILPEDGVVVAALANGGNEGLDGLVTQTVARLVGG